MKVLAEVRDWKLANKWNYGIVVFFSIYLILLIAAIICGGTLKGIFVIVAFLLMVLLIPIIIIGCILASHAYKSTWAMEEFDLYAKDRQLYFEEIPMHVNYNPLSDVLYIHNLGSDAAPAKDILYMTVYGEEKDRLKEYMDNNLVELEEEHIVQGKGKFGIITTMGIGMSKYRRR